MEFPKAKFERFEDLLADPDHAVVVDFWKKLLDEYPDPPLPMVTPGVDDGFVLTWADDNYTLDVKLGSTDDDGWFYTNHMTKEYTGSEDHEPNIDIKSFARLLKETPWEFGSLMSNEVPKILGIEMRPCEFGTAWELNDVVIRPGTDGKYYYIYWINGTHRGCTDNLEIAVKNLENVILQARDWAAKLGT